MKVCRKISVLNTLIIGLYIDCPEQIFTRFRRPSRLRLTLILLTWRIWWTPNNASRWQMGFNSVFKRLKFLQTEFLYFSIRRQHNRVPKIDSLLRCNGLHNNQAIWFHTSLIPQSTAVPCKLIVAQFVRFRSCCENRTFITFFRNSRLTVLTVRQMQPLQCTLSTPTHYWSTSLYHSHLCIAIPTTLPVGAFGYNYSFPCKLHMMLSRGNLSKDPLNTLRTGDADLPF